MNKINVERKIPLEVPSEEKERMRGIRDMDWNRLKRLIEQIPKDTSLFQILYSLFFGVATTSGLSIIPLKAAQNVPVWVVPFYWCLTIFSIIVAFTFCWIDSRVLKKRKIDHIKNIQDDIKEIESTFPS